MPVSHSKYKHQRDPRDTRTTLLYVMTLLLGCGMVVMMQGRWVSQNQDVFRFDPSKKFMTGPNGSKLVICSHCSFHGRVEVDGEEYMCPICFGVGGNYIKRVDTGEHGCLYCDGMGHILDGKGIKSQVCPVCMGRGAKRVAYGQSMCPVCEGMGSEFDEESDSALLCGLCGGVGEIFEDVPFTMDEVKKK